ncbi:GntR family transcriptional regulator [Enterococcus sp. JM9B]|uniref:GntR family transcriptional regulator n=1 Tax=Enterococcus sp. JM9B TaxID=1857216 RepID=UPI001374F96E|nr:LacI family DNA-binding transcriptional regulator [Enterococcus sp. JM9B]KAF1303181.1 GntR family transcriptional regulator [Enterococcus sp. JM9B]
MKEPLYKTILQDLVKDIKKGTFPAGAQLPTEKELSEKYQVSRITSKRALTELEQAGLIYRLRGKGSFVKATNQAEKKVTTHRILFLLPFVNDLSVGNFNEGLTPFLQKKKYDVLLTTSDFLTQKNADDIQKEFDGLIYYALDTEQHLDILFELSLKNFPVVILDKKIYDLPFPTVLSDNRSGGKLATEFLIQSGHQKIAYLFGNQVHPQSVRQRYLGYIQAINQAGITFHTSLDDPLATTKNLWHYLQLHNITGLVCENDLVAIEAMRIIKQHQQQVPKDFSVIGFDDIQAAALVDPPLTTVVQDFRTLGQTAGTFLINWIEKGELSQDHNVPVHLIKRASTKETTKEKSQ